MVICRLLVVLTVCWVVNGHAESEDDGELLLVQVIFRHGARTTYATYPNDPYINETYYPYGWGGLTNEGKLGEYRLGQFLRKYYLDFVGEDYHDNKLYVRSTDTQRTRASAQLVLAGLFPPSKNLLWNEDLRWQPIPVSYRNVNDEDIFHTRECAYRRRVIDELVNNPDVQQKYIKPYEELFRKVETHSGKSIEHPERLQDFYFIVQTQSELNYTLPEWTKEVFPEPIQTVSSLTYEYHNYDPEARKINVGYMLRYILGNCDNKIANTIRPRDRKMFLFSGHETTVGYMLDALLNESINYIPAYGSTLSFELRRKNGEHYIRVRYRKSTYGEYFEDISLPNCGVFCPIEKFKKVYESIIPTLSFQEACKLERYNKERSDIHTYSK